ncbi:MAG: agmatinase [Nitrosarchaeum sp.]|nr:agmatinase [Nitrosarchaeum sp.]
MARGDKTICWANSNSYEESDIVIVGIPDQSHSHSIRKGTALAPNAVRDASNKRDVYVENKIRSIAYTNSGKNNAKIFDYGNIARKDITKIFAKFAKDSKIPITVGGDHSLTTPLIKSFAEHKRPISLVYFDAHPDFLSSTHDFYGSVLYDILPYIDKKSSVLVGIRSPEQEEIVNIQTHGIKVISPQDVQYNGIKNTINEILKIVGSKTYLSFDMDCLDPAFAPGVSVPVPFGLSSTESLAMVNEIAKHGIIGMDIMEICPPFDIQDFTSHLASRLIGEVLSSIKDTKKITKIQKK